MTFMKQTKRPKCDGPVFCIYCNSACNPDTDEFVITKRRTVNYFHKRCYYVYSKLGFNLVDQEDKQ